MHRKRKGTNRKGRDLKRKGMATNGRWNDRLCVGQDLIGIEKAEI